MDIRHLEYFVEVARFRSFSRAAREIHVAQSTLSRTIQELEPELGNQLFRRSYQSIALTEFGERFLQKANQVLAGFRELKALSQKDSREIFGKLYVGLPPITAVTAFSSVLAGFKKKYPFIKVILFDAPPKQVERMLKQSLLDFGVFLPRNRSLYDWIWFDQDLHGLLVTEDNPLLQGAPSGSVGYAGLGQEPLIIYNQDYLVHDQLLEGFQENQMLPNIILETSQLEMMLSLVLHHAGTAVLPRKLCRQLAAIHPGLGCLDLEDRRLKMDLALTWLRSHPLSEAGKLFQDFLQQHLAEKGFVFEKEN